MYASIALDHYEIERLFAFHVLFASHKFDLHYSGGDLVLVWHFQRKSEITTECVPDSY